MQPLRSTLTAAILLIAAAAAQAQTPDAPAPAQRLQPCKGAPTIVDGKIALAITNTTNTKCQAGAPLFIWGGVAKEVSQRVCDFSKTVNVREAQTFHESDEVRCVFTGEVLDGRHPIVFSKLDENRKLAEL